MWVARCRALAKALLPWVTQNARYLKKAQDSGYSMGPAVTLLSVDYDACMHGYTPLSVITWYHDVQPNSLQRRKNPIIGNWENDTIRTRALMKLHFVGWRRLWARHAGETWDSVLKHIFRSSKKEQERHSHSSRPPKADKYSCNISPPSHVPTPRTPFVSCSASYYTIALSYIHGLLPRGGLRSACVRATWCYPGVHTLSMLSIFQMNLEISHGHFGSWSVKFSWAVLTSYPGEEHEFYIVGYWLTCRRHSPRGFCGSIDSRISHHTLETILWILGKKSI